jgi:hypothetical protein
MHPWFFTGIPSKGHQKPVEASAMTEDKTEDLFGTRTRKVGT